MRIDEDQVAAFDWEAETQFWAQVKGGLSRPSAVPADEQKAPDWDDPWADRSLPADPEPF